MFLLYQRVLVLCVLACLVGGHIAYGQEKVLTFPPDDPKSKRAVVARIGPLKITAEEFRLSFEFGPAFAKRTGDARQRYLGYMINEKLLALGAMSRKDGVRTLIAPALAEIEGDLATEELYKEDVQSKVKVSGTEIARGVGQTRRHVTLQWIFAPTKKEIDRYATLLRAGPAFDSLYRAQGADSLLAANRSMEGSLFRIWMKNGEIASVADTLQPGRSSAPMKGPDGWYILRLATLSRDVLTTQSDEMKLRNDVHRALLKQRSDSLSELYITSLMTRSRPAIVPETFDLLSSYLALKFLDPHQIREWNMAGPGGEGNDSAALATIDKRGKLPLVTLAGGTKILLKDFLTWYRTRETLIKVVKGSKQAYLFSLQQVIWQMVRDNVLVGRAFKRNLQARESVRTQKRWWEEKLLYEAEKKLIVDSISFHDRGLQAYFEDNRRHYKDPRGVPSTFSEARDDILRDYYEYEVTRRILHRLNRLKREYPVSIDESVLARIPVEGDPRAINLYAVKKGGTFPRPAFPVIDQLWRTWN